MNEWEQEIQRAALLRQALAAPLPRNECPEPGSGRRPPVIEKVQGWLIVSLDLQ